MSAEPASFYNPLANWQNLEALPQTPAGSKLPAPYIKGSRGLVPWRVWVEPTVLNLPF
jgi:hypothetical protein